MKIASCLVALAGPAAAFAPARPASRRATSLAISQAEGEILSWCAFLGVFPASYAVFGGEDGAAALGEGGAAAAPKPDIDFSGEIGAVAPLGFFDPIGLVRDADQERFDRLRETEIKHGRVSMLATVGYLATAAGWRLPGLEGVPDGLAAFPALAATGDGANVLSQLGAFCLLGEIVNRNVEWSDVEAEFPGDYRNGSIDWGWDKFSDEKKLRKRNIELNNGRAAMCGILGLMVHERLGVSVLPGGYLPGQPAGAEAAAAAADPVGGLEALAGAAAEAVADVAEAAADAL